jgi:hypothetical protein
VLQIVDLASRRVTPNPSSERKFNQRWSPEGRFLTYWGGKVPGICRISLATRQTELIATVADSDRALDGIWRPWMGITPQGDPLILRNADFQQIYLLSFGGN